MNKVIIVGGGAAGMMAAISASKEGKKVCILEKNEKLGKKLFITGKGRCNITNACPADEFLTHVVTNPRFLYSTFSQFNNEDMMDYLEEIGLPIKTERGQRVFPQSDRSSDVIDALKKQCKKGGVQIYYHTEVKELLFDEEKENCVGVLLSDGKKMMGDSVILACGGFSYASTGSNGSGYTLAKQAGHKIKSIEPSLVPFEMKEMWCKDLMGFTLKNIGVRIKAKKKTVYEGFGEFLFTHFGVSGPLILSASAAIKQNTIKKPLQMFIDLKPALSYEALDKRILREFDDAKNKQFKNSINKLLPSKMIPVIIGLSGIDPDKKVNEISKGEREGLVNLLKKLPVTLNGTRQWNEAIVTKGGISTKDINPSTMESKIIKNLYFAGEVLDLDALTGGYNLQIAWSTGALAGKSINKEE